MTPQEDWLKQCRWPELKTPYAEALREAIRFILSQVEVLGIIASGTIIRGNPRQSSDLDLYVIHAESKRQRIQKRFNGVPAEIFINPVNAIEGYFAQEQSAARPLTAHMLATGFVILDRDPVVERLREQSRKLLAQPPQASDHQLLFERYAIATRYEDALDIVEDDSAAAHMMLGLAVYDMLHYRFRQAGQFFPRDKDLLLALGTLDKALADAAREFYETSITSRRLALAAQIAQKTIGVLGFFEWETPLEEV